MQTPTPTPSDANLQNHDAVMIESSADLSHTDDSELQPAQEKRKKSKKKEKEFNEEIGSKRGVETMFRNVFRSELDLITLAATKANIMISLNGFIVSALMISGAFIYASTPIFLIPVAVFMLTATGSIVFALISASPERGDMLRNTRHWLGDVFRGKARLADFRERVWCRKEQFVGEHANILIYEDRVKLSKEAYWEEMQAIMNNREQVYEKMSDLLYWIGTIADKKFKYLHLSYKIFRWGLLATILSFVSLKLLPVEKLQMMIPPIQQIGEPKQEPEQAIAESLTEEQKQQFNLQQLDSTYEPSAVQQLADGRLLVAEDEYLYALGLLTINETGQVIENEAIDSRLVRSMKNKLSDVEGLTSDDEGYLYAITSHSSNKKGERREDREQLIRFKIYGNQAQEIEVYTNLVDELNESASLKQLLQEKLGQQVDFATINIEGLTYDHKHQRLMIGFRDPDVDKKSLILAISNPKQVFTENATPIFSDVFTLDLKGGGIRSLSYDIDHDVYWLSNELGEKGNRQSQLWVWNGTAETQPREIYIAGLELMTNVEAVDVVQHQGKTKLVLMSDEGSAKRNVGGRLMWVDNLEELLKQP